MTTPNWQHNSGKNQKRKLKPQALRNRRKARSALINKLNSRPANAPGGYGRHRTNASDQNNNPGQAICPGLYCTLS